MIRWNQTFGRQARAMSTRQPLAASYSPPAISQLEQASTSDWSPKDLNAVEETYLLPPPNVTGKLHMGHALTVTIQDSVVRFKRLQGKRVRWVYGLDHAGIATQSVVERHLFKTERKTKDQLGREAFVNKVWEWTNDHKGKIKSQLKLLSASLDYDREYFTLDEEHSVAVTEAFVRLHEKGLLRRSRRMVNWCPQLRTALSDLEVDRVELAGPTEISFGNGIKAVFGVADDFAYRVSGGSNAEEIVVRTTRLETMLGDVAVVVHPDDDRYKHLIGKHVVHPFQKDKLLPIVADEKLVDMSMGTGAVKLTPAHDPFDFECAKRMNLPIGECIFTEEGHMSVDFVPKEFSTLHRFVARERLRQRLTELGLYRGQHKHPLVLGRCSRTGDVIEPILKWQWFIDGRHLANTAQTAVKDQKMTFFPAEQRVIWNMWLDNSQDWCVSRQLWWGHRIPAFRTPGTGEAGWIVARTEADARKLLGLSDLDPVERDEDVLDTWFSSALLPIGVFGWPKSARGSTMTTGSVQSQLKWMETGSDILFFWVARMVMMCTELNNGLLPFPHVHLHSMVRDRRGRKMSKSLGNVIDPLDVIKGVSLEDMLQALKSGNLDPNEVGRASADLTDQFSKTGGIPAYGTDSLRMALASYPATVPQVLFDLDRVAQARLFCNKIWQAARFVQGRLTKPVSLTHSGDDVHVRWIKHRLSGCAEECTAAYDRMDVESAQSAHKKFFWNDFCDVFLECSKFEIHPEAEAKALEDCLRASLILLHPIAPNITGELWSHLTESPMTLNDPALSSFKDEDAERSMNLCLDIVRAIRSLKLRFGNKASDFTLVVSDGAPASNVIELAKKLSRCGSLTVDEGVTTEALKQDKALLEPLAVVSGVVRVSSASDDLRKLAEAELERINKRLAAVEKSLASEKGRLESASFLERAPPSVREKTQEKVRALEAELAALNISKHNLGG